MNELAINKDFAGLERAALALYESGYFNDAKSEAQAIVKVMAGSELGLPPFAAMSGIHIIQGKPTLGSNVIATLVKNDPRYDYHVKQSDNNACILTWYENGKLVGEAGFTIQEANAAGLTNKDNWKKYTSDMLFARAISRGSRRFAPGIFGGSPVYTPDEMGVDTDEEGFINVKVHDITDEHEKSLQEDDSISDQAVGNLDAENPAETVNEASDDKLDRDPHDPETLKVGLQVQIKKYDSLLEQDPGKYQVQVEQDGKIIASVIDKYIGGLQSDSLPRYAVFTYLLGEGKGSTKTWTYQELGAVKNIWLKITQFGETLGAVEEEELRQLWNFVQTSQGQTGMFA